MHGFRIPHPWIPDSITNNLDSGLQLWLDSGSHYISWTQDSKAVNSGFHRLKLPGFRIPDYFTWGDPATAFVTSSAITEPLNNPEMFTWLCNWNKYHGLEFELDWLM